jgi:hypothetical protein
MERKNKNRGFKSLRVWQDAVSIFESIQKIKSHFPIITLPHPHSPIPHPSNTPIPQYPITPIYLNPSKMRIAEDLTEPLTSLITSCKIIYR